MTAARAALRRISIADPVARFWARSPLGVRIAIQLALLAAAVILPRGLSNYWQSVLFFPVCLYILLALGLNIVVGAAGLLDLGYVAFYAVGAYTTAKLTTAADWNVWTTLPVAIALAMLAGVILGGPTLRLRGDYLAIVTLGFGEIVRLIAQNSGSLGEARGITGIPHPSGVGSVQFGSDPLPYYYLALAAVLISLVLVVRLRNSRVGRSWSAIREDEDAAEAMGVPTFKMKLWAFAMGASTGGLGGWIYASKVSFINPDNFPLFLSIVILAAVVLGGMGSFPGVVAGGFLIAFLPEYLRNAAAGEQITDGLNWLIGGDFSNVTEYRDLLFGLALVLVMVFRPQGLIPNRERAAELHDPSAAASLGGIAPTEALTTEVEEAISEDEEAAAAGIDLAAGADVDQMVGASEEVVVGEPVLDLQNVSMSFGGVHALTDVNLTVRRGEIFGIIGPNGAGKTTIFNCITGIFQPSTGEITLAGRALVGSKPHQITEAGIARTFQNIRLFPNMSAIVNVVIGTDARHDTSVPGAVIGSPRHRREERAGQAEAFRLLQFVGIAHRAHEQAKNLPYGDQRRLEIARALATGPTVLLLDEPAAGMNPSEKRSLIELIREIRDMGFTVVLIEHDMGLVMNVCERIAVLDFGEKIAEGRPAEIQSDPRVIEAYLGVPADAS